MLNTSRVHMTYLLLTVPVQSVQQLLVNQLLMSYLVGQRVFCEGECVVYVGCGRVKVSR